MGSEAHLNTTQCPPSWAVVLISIQDRAHHHGLGGGGHTSINTTSWAVRLTSTQHYGQWGSPQYNTVSTIMGSGVHLNATQGPPSWAGGHTSIQHHGQWGTSIQKNLQWQWVSPQEKRVSTIMGSGAHLNERQSLPSWPLDHSSEGSRDSNPQPGARSPQGHSGPLCLSCAVVLVLAKQTCYLSQPNSIIRLVV